jgi:hypothetical protein
MTVVDERVALAFYEFSNARLDEELRTKHPTEDGTPAVRRTGRSTMPGRSVPVQSQSNVVNLRSLPSLWRGTAEETQCVRPQLGKLGFSAHGCHADVRWTGYGT